MIEVSEHLKETLDWLEARARLVSNMNKWQTDNGYGRLHTELSRLMGLEKVIQSDEVRVEI